MKLAALMSLLCGAGLVVSLHADAPAQPGMAAKDGAPEVNVVLRISRKFIAELTTKKFQRTDPVYLCVLDSPITGTAWTDATFSVQFDTSTKESAFVLQLQGSTTSATVAERTWLQVFGSGQMDFTVSKRVTFDGKKYRGQPSTVDASLCSSVDGIATPPGLIGWIIQLIAAPEVRRQQPFVAEVAYEDGRAKLTDGFDQEAIKLLDQLNQVSPLQETVATLFPETRDWTFYLSTTPTHLIIGTGPPERLVPELPVTSQTQAPIELWIRGKQETQGMLKVLKLWQDAGKQLETLLPAELQKTIKPGDGFKTLFVKEWFVIQLGTGGLKDRQEESNAEPTAVVWRPVGGASIAGPSGDFAGLLLGPDRGEESGGSATVVWRPASRSTEGQPENSGTGDKRITVVWRPVLTHWEATLQPSSWDH